jgi:hypothetical protein
VSDMDLADARRAAGEARDRMLCAAARAASVAAQAAADQYGAAVDEYLRLSESEDQQ